MSESKCPDLAAESQHCISKCMDCTLALERSDGLMRFVWLLFILAACAASFACRRTTQADLIIHHGKIVTVDAGFRVVEALAIKGNRVLATGSNKEMLALASSTTQQVDLQSKTVLPGLIDSHLHAVGAAMYEFDHPVPDMQTVGDVLAYIKARAETIPTGEWVHLSQVFITRLKEQRYPTRQELDRAAPRNPVVFSTGPDASLNTLALRRSGIDRNFQGGDCRVERDVATGEPTGILRNCSPYIKFKSPEKQPAQEDYLQRVRMLLADYNSVGITSIVDGDTSDAEVEIYRQLKARGQLSCRTFLVLHVDANAPLERIEARIRQAAGNPLHQYDNMLWLRGIKSYLDGGMLTEALTCCSPGASVRSTPSPILPTGACCI